jgi:WD40 repeat protein
MHRFVFPPLWFPHARSVWDLSTGMEKNKMEGHGLNVTHVAISQDGKNIISTSFDKTVR